MLVAAMLASIWVALMLSAPWLPVPVAGIVYVFGGRICHQLAERSFFLEGAQLPICARCLGITVGVAAGLLLSGAHRLEAAVRHTPARVGGLMLLVLALNLVTLGDASTNAVRASVGAALGVAVALALRSAVGVRPLRMPTPHTKRASIH